MNNVAAIIGSGTIPFTYAILSPTKGGTNPNAEGIRTGLQVMVANPEDLVSVDKWVSSGINIGTSPTKIWGPEINLLPRQRGIIIQNGTTNADIFIGPTEESVITPSGFLLRRAPGFTAHIQLPLMHNNTVWARAGTDGVDINIVAF